VWPYAWGFIQARSAYLRVDSGGMALIHCVAALGLDWAIPAMTNSGADVNQPDRRHRTALHWAAAKGHEDTVVRAKP
jgi:ankyrin repeat protein